MDNASQAIKDADNSAPDADNGAFCAWPLSTLAAITDMIRDVLVQHEKYLEMVMPALFGLRVFELDHSDMPPQLHAQMYHVSMNDFSRRKALYDAVVWVACACFAEERADVRRSNLRVSINEDGAAAPRVGVEAA